MKALAAIILLKPEAWVLFLPSGAILKFIMIMVYSAYEDNSSELSWIRATCIYNLHV